MRAVQGWGDFGAVADGDESHIEASHFREIVRLGALRQFVEMLMCSATYWKLKRRREIPGVLILWRSVVFLISVFDVHRRTYVIRFDVLSFMIDPDQHFRLDSHQKHDDAEEKEHHGDQQKRIPRHVVSHEMFHHHDRDGAYEACRDDTNPMPPYR